MAAEAISLRAPARSEARVAVGVWRGWLSVAGLTGLAVTLPLLRVLAPHPEFFLAHQVGRTGVIVFAAFVAVGLPVAVGAVAAVAGLVTPALRTVVVTVVGAVAVAGLLQPFAGVAQFPLIVVAGGLLLAAVERRSHALRNGLAVAAVVSVLAGAWFVGLSRTSQYVFSDESAAVVDTALADREHPPVVFLVFDEFPMTALLGPDLKINRERFPNFARLADQSDWYRLASSVSPQTAHSVPALFSGQRPTTAVGVASEYPTNVFLQFGSVWEVFGYEPLTALCPPTLCGTPAPDQSAAADGSSSEGPTGLSWLLHDALVVLGHTVGPAGLQESLPPVDHAWAGFREAPTSVVAVSAEDDAEAGEFTQLGADATYVGARKRLLELFGNRPTGDRPPLYAAHVITPHLPYIANPSGSVYAHLPPAGIQTAQDGLTWPAGSEAFRRQGYQRLLLQLGGVDTLLGELIAELEADGLWDDAAVVVTADHGASFEEGQFRDVAAADAEVWNVPLFVKQPGQQRGSVHDDAALTIDALPTLLGAAGVRSPSRFDGMDLAQGDVPTQRKNGFRADTSVVTVDQSLDALRELVDRRARWIDPAGGWDAVYRVGPGGEHVGQLARGVDTEAGSFTWTDPKAGTSGLRNVRTINVSGDDVAGAEGVIVAVDGRFVGGGAPIQPGGDVTVVLDELAFPHDSRTLDVYLVDADGALLRPATG